MAAANTRSTAAAGTVTVEAVASKEEDEVKRVFKRFDSDGDGKISASEICDVFRALGSGASAEELAIMMEEIDSDGDGYVDLKEFSDFFFKAADGDGQLKEAFKMYDLDGNGRISAKELHQVLKRIGEKCSFGDCTRMIRSVDADGDGCVDFQEFKKMMTKSSSDKKK